MVVRGEEIKSYCLQGGKNSEDGWWLWLHNSVNALVQSLSHARLFATPWTATCQASLSFTISWSLLRLLSVESVMPSNHSSSVTPLHLLPWTSPSIRLFSNESALYIRWPKYWSFSFSISLPNEYSWLISFRMDWFDLFAVQGTLKSFLQHHNLKASILWHSAFFMVQLSHPYMMYLMMYLKPLNGILKMVKIVNFICKHILYHNIFLKSFF